MTEGTDTLTDGTVVGSCRLEMSISVAAGWSTEGPVGTIKVVEIGRITRLPGCATPSDLAINLIGLDGIDDKDGGASVGVLVGTTRGSILEAICGIYRGIFVVIINK